MLNKEELASWLYPKCAKSYDGGVGGAADVVICVIHVVVISGDIVILLVMFFRGHPEIDRGGGTLPLLFTSNTICAIPIHIVRTKDVRIPASAP